MSLSEIYEGWRNQLLPPSHLKEQIKMVSDERMKICKGCEWNSVNRENYNTIRPDEHCTKCGCTISAKTKCLSCRCPLPAPNTKWKAVISREIEEIINNEIQD
jgi:hypothetical protein